MFFMAGQRGLLGGELEKPLQQYSVLIQYACQVVWARYQIVLAFLKNKNKLNEMLLFNIYWKRFYLKQWNSFFQAFYFYFTSLLILVYFANDFVGLFLSLKSFNKWLQSHQFYLLFQRNSLTLLNSNIFFVSESSLRIFCRFLICLSLKHQYKLIGKFVSKKCLWIIELQFNSIEQFSLMSSGLAGALFQLWILVNKPTFLNYSGGSTLKLLN